MASGQPLHERAVHRDRVRPPHEPQHPVAAALQRHVEVRRDRRRRRDRISARRSEKYAGSTEDSRSQRRPGHLDEPLEQGGQARARREVARRSGRCPRRSARSPDARPRRAVAPARRRPRGSRLRLAPRASGHDAEGAPVLAAVLDLDEGARATSMRPQSLHRIEPRRRRCRRPDPGRAALRGQQRPSRSGSRVLVRHCPRPDPRRARPRHASGIRSAPSSRSPRRGVGAGPRARGGWPGDPRTRRAP